MITFSAWVTGLMTKGETAEGAALADGKFHQASHLILSCTIDAGHRTVLDRFRPAKRLLGGFHQSPAPIPVFRPSRSLGTDGEAYIGRGYQDLIFKMAINHVKAPSQVPSDRAIISARPFRTRPGSRQPSGR